MMIIVPPGSDIDDMDKLKGKTVGVVGGEVNRGVVAILTKEYDLDRAKVQFKDVAPRDVQQALQSKQISALLVVLPVSEKYLSIVRGFFQKYAKNNPGLIRDRVRPAPSRPLRIHTKASNCRKARFAALHRSPTTI